MPYKEFNLQYASIGGRSIDLYEAFNVRTEVGGDDVKQIWQNYTDNVLAVGDQDVTTTTIEPITGPVVREPSNIQTGVGKNNVFQGTCGTKKLFKALLDFVNCELKLEDEIEAQPGSLS